MDDALYLPAGGQPTLPTSVRDHLADRLRESLRPVLEGGVPERIRTLLADLERALRAAGGVPDEFRDGLLGAATNLRGFALSLTHDATRADDLVQDTLVKAWQNSHRFEPGTNLHAWLFTIMRNVFYSNHRRRTREVEDADGAHAARMSTYPTQERNLDVGDLRTALSRLPEVQSSALVLVAVEGWTYDQVAAQAGVAVGTIKSRVSRAREKLAELLGYDGDEIGGDRVLRGVVEAAA